MSSRRRRISSNPVSVSKMEVLAMDHLCGSWGWFACAGLGSSLAGSVPFKALLDILVVQVQGEGRGDV
jgi:hypothetical protein